MLQYVYYFIFFTVNKHNSMNSHVLSSLSKLPQQAGGVVPQHANMLYYWADWTKPRSSQVVSSVFFGEHAAVQACMVSVKGKQVRELLAAAN